MSPFNAEASEEWPVQYGAADPRALARSNPASGAAVGHDSQALPPGHVTNSRAKDDRR